MKKLLVVLLALTMVFAFVGCQDTTPTATTAPATTAVTPQSQAPATTAAPATPEAKSFTLKYNILEPLEHPQGITMSTFKEKIEALSGGQIMVDIYPSGQLFGQEAEVQALTDGDLDMSNIAFQDIAPYVPTAAMFAAPYAFVSYEHAGKVLDPASAVAADFYPMVEEACNYTPIGWMTQGQRCLDLKTETPIMKPEDLKANNVLLRMPNAEAWLNAGKSLGADVVGIAYAETYTALQTGTVTAQDNPLPGTYAMKFYEVTKQISLTKHIIDCKLICINTDVWNEMTEEQQGWMIEAAKAAGEAGNQATYDQEEELLTFMRDDAKLIITEPDIDAFQTYSHQYYVDNGLAANWDMALYDLVQSLK